MKFSATIEGIELVITLEQDKLYRPHDPLSSFSLQDLEDLKEDIVRIYEVNVISSKGTDKMEHYTTGILLSSDETELAEEIDEILEEFGFVEHIIKHWKLEQTNLSTPDWAKVE